MSRVSVVRSPRAALSFRALLGLALLSSSSLTLGQSLSSTERPPTASSRSTEALAQRALRQSEIAEAQLEQGRVVMRRLGGKHGELKQRYQATEKALQEAQRDARQALVELAADAEGRGNAQRDAARDRLQRLLMPPVLIQLDAEPEVFAARALSALSPMRAARQGPGPADLVATLDAPITPAIQARADALGQQPVAIFEWVRKSIDFVPSYGSLQGAQGTLETGRGNATDQASLLIALLRASGIHSRYVHGHVEIEAARAMRWFGVDRIEAVTELLTEGGIAFETVLGGGSVRALRFEHVWVEAWIDFAPSRGARHASGDAWVGLDPSYKDLDFTAGIDLATLMALDRASLQRALQAAAVIDSGGHYLSAFGADVLAAQLSAASSRLREVLRQRGLADASIGELLPAAADATPDYPFFLGNLPYAVLTQEAPATALSEERRHRLRWHWQVDDNGLPGADLLSLDQPTVALAGKDVEIRWVPAEAVDREVLAALIPDTLLVFEDLPESLPAYMIEVRAELWIDDTRAARSEPVGLGKTLHGGLEWSRPGGSVRRQREAAFAGELRALSLGWHGGLGAQVERSVAALRDAQQSLLTGGIPSSSALSSALLQLGGRGHFAVSDAYQSWLAGLGKVRFHRAASAASAYTALEVAAPFGVVTTVWPAGFGLSDVSAPHFGSALVGGDEPRFVHQSLYAQSQFGHLLLQQLYDGSGRSAARLLRSALDAQAPVYQYQRAQQADLAARALPESVNTAVAAALARGERASFVAEAQTIGDWQGLGAVLTAPQALGGTSFIYGQSRSEASTQLTGASVSSAVARGALLSGLLGDASPPALVNAWLGELDAPIATGEGLLTIINDPAAMGMTDLMVGLASGAIVDQTVGGVLDPLIGDQLFSSLVTPILGIAPLVDAVPPVVNLRLDPASIELGQHSDVIASASDNKGVSSFIVTVDGAPVTLSNGRYRFTPTRAGSIPVVARARDEAGNLTERSADLLVREPGDGAPPVVAITSPLDNALVTGPIQITGTVRDASLRRWTLSMRPGNSPNVQPVLLGSGTQQVDNGVLGALDPTLMFNGVYIIGIWAEDANGLINFDSIQVRVDGDMKVGHFRISFEEIEIPLQGIPIRITRTYDTRQANESMDFGHGWSIDYQNVRIRESRKLGFSWRMAQGGGGFSPFCVRPSGTPTVTINLPDGQTEQFRAKWSPECQQFLPPVYGELVFEPLDSGTTSKLEQLDYGVLRVANLGNSSNLIDLGEPDQPVDPKRYKLSTRDGLTYYLDQDFGIQRIVDEAGNSVQYTRDGITHSSGTSVQFVRDNKGRITAIVLPDGRRLTYSYSAAGDLLEAKDTLGQATRFDYLTNVRYPHYLEKITDARGVPAVRHEYDNDGRLIATTDAAGERIEFVHNIAGRTETIKNRRGFSTTYVYDDNGYVLSETNALGEQTLRTYDANGNELTRTDPLGRTTRYTLDPRGNALTEADPLGNVTTRTWGYYNQLLTEVDPEGRPAITNEYWRNPLAGETSGYLTASTDALGNTTRFALDLCGSSCGNTGNITAITDAAGGTTRFGYGRAGNLNSETDAEGNVTTRTYDSMGRVLEESRTRTINGTVETLKTSYTYDGKGRLTATTHPDGSITRSTYNAIDKVETSTDALGRVTRYAYDARGNQTSVTHPDGSSERSEYDPEGNVIAQTDRAGRTTRMVYDAANRLIETIHPDDTPGNDSDNPRERSEYDAAGQMVASIDAAGRRTTYRYDGAGRQIEVEDALGNITRSEYDKSGRRIAVTDALGRTTRFVYDLAGRVTETVHPDATPGDLTDNPRSRFEYDALGRKIAEIDEMGRITRFAYDRLSRLVAVVLPNPATGANPPLVDGNSPEPGALVTRYAYDEQGNKISQTDAEGRITRWTFDGMGRQRSRVLPMGQQEQFEYDAGGQPSAHLTFNGERIETSHDSLGRIATLTLPGGHVRRFSYSASGRVSQIDDNGAVYGFEYDARDRLSRAVDPQGRAIDYRFDAVGNRTELATSRQQIRYAFDELHRLREVVAQLDGGTPQTTSYAYDAVGNRSGMSHPNGTTVEYGYDLRNRLSSLVHRARQAAGAAVLLGLSYTVDASGLRTEIAETRPGTTTAITRSSAYTYDWVKRLTREQVTGTNSQGRTSTWTYDKVGNRKSESTFGTFSKSLSYTYDANDRLTREQGSPATFDYVYDNAGNLLQKKQGSTVVASYSWSAEGRMLGATIGTGANQIVTQYRYDPSGIRRSQEAVAAGVRSRTEYLVDPNQAYAQVLEDWEASGPSANPLPAASLGNVYLHGDDLISQTLLANNIAASTQVYHYDGLGSTRALSHHALDSSGNPLANHGQVSDRYAYTAFGEADPAGTSGNNTNATENAYRYTGEQLDPNLGFYYLRARYMDPRGGRFLGMDAFAGYGSQPQSLNKFAYTHFDPVNNTDPTGFFNLAEKGAAQSVSSTLSLSSYSTVTINTARVAANDAFWATAANGTAVRMAGVNIMTGLAIAAISQRSSTPRDRLIGVPIIVFGQDFPGHAEHIRDAQTANGSNFVMAPFALNHTPEWPRGWYNADAVVECNKEARARLPGQVCDEYPFASTRQGGPVNYVFGGVSLRLLDRTESSRTGGFLGSFYRAARLSPDGFSKQSRFMAFGVPGVRSFYTDRDGRVHFFGGSGS